MEETYRAVSLEACRIVVIVEELQTGNFCVGFVAVNTEETNTTLIFTSLSVLEKTSNLLVHFKDKTGVPAKVLVRGQQFSLLAVDYNPDCKTLKFREEDVDDPTEAIILAPTSKSCLSHIPGFVMQSSCHARDDRMKYIEGSENYFQVSCHYADNGDRGQKRLISAPVFDMESQAIGIITSQCGTSKNKIDVKIGLSASTAQKVLLDLMEESKSLEKKAGSTTDEERHPRRRSRPLVNHPYNLRGKGARNTSISNPASCKRRRV